MVRNLSGDNAIHRDGIWWDRCGGRTGAEFYQQTTRNGKANHGQSIRCKEPNQTNGKLEISGKKRNYDKLGRGSNLGSKVRSMNTIGEKLSL